MARIRTVKPEIHQDEAIGELTDAAFRLFIGLITQADDAGRLKGDPRLIGAQVWPYQPKKKAEVENWLDELDRAGLIRRYAHAGKPFICLPSWDEHQRVDNAGRSKIPPPEEADGSLAESRREPPRTAAGSRTKDQGEEQGSRKGTSATCAAAAPLSHLLADLVEQNGARRPGIGKRWLDAERLLIARDERDPAEAERLLRWSQRHHFWHRVILSMPKFREQYDRLLLDAKAETNGGRPDPKARRVAELIERGRRAASAA